MNNNNKVLKYLYICFGFFITIYIIYIRILLVRVPKDLHINFCTENYNIKLGLLLLSILICGYILITNIKMELNIEKKSNILSNSLNLLFKTIENSLKQFFAFVLSFYENKYDLLSNISRKFYNYWHIYPEYYLLFIIYIIRAFILSIFLFEIFITFKFNYFYKSLILLCIVLFIKALIFVLKDFACNLTEYENALIIEYCLEEKTHMQTITYKLKPNYLENDLNFVVQEFKLCNKLSGYLEMYDRYAYFFTSKVNIFIYSLYLFGWLYILYYNLIF